MPDFQIVGLTHTGPRGLSGSRINRGRYPRERAFDGNGNGFKDIPAHDGDRTHDLLLTKQTHYHYATWAGISMPGKILTNTHISAVSDMNRFTSP